MTRFDIKYFQNVKYQDKSELISYATLYLISYLENKTDNNMAYQIYEKEREKTKQNNLF